MGFLVGASLIMSGVSAFKAAGAASDAAQTNIDIALVNHELIESGAVDEENNLRRQQQKTIGAMRANFGASGVRLEGSPLEVLAESVAAAETDLETLRHNTRLRLKGARLGAQLDLSRAKSQRTGAFLG